MPNVEASSLPRYLLHPMAPEYTLDTNTGRVMRVYNGELVAVSMRKPAPGRNGLIMTLRINGRQRSMTQKAFVMDCLTDQWSSK